MKQIKPLTLLLTLFIFLLTACNTVSLPSSVPTYNPTVVPTATAAPTPTPMPEPEFPIEFHWVTEQNHDDSKMIYIDLVLLDTEKYASGSFSSLLAADVNKDVMEYNDMILKSAEEYPATEENNIRYGLGITPDIKTNGPGFLSFYIDYYTNTGGAHPNTTRTAYNYDGNGMKIHDFMKVLDPAVTLMDVEQEINRQMAANIEEMGPMYFEDSISFSKLGVMPSFYIENDTLIIYFQTYDIAPYAAGLQEFKLPSESFPLIIN